MQPIIVTTPLELLHIDFMSIEITYGVGSATKYGVHSSLL